VRELVGEPQARGRRIAIVASRFNEVVVRKLLEGAVECLRARGIADGDLDLAWVPGSFELPLIARRLGSSGSYDAIICLGAVIRGETSHFDYVADQAASGIRQAADHSGIPVIFGVVTTDTLEQALDRAGGAHGNRGWDAAVAALEMASLLEQLPKGGPEAS